MFRIIEEENETQTAIQNFYDKIQSLAIEHKSQDWIFPSGGQENYETYLLKTKSGKIKVAFAGNWGGREAHLFTLDTELAKLTPNLEINIPYTRNPNVGGVFIKNGERLALAHRGIINAFRGRIPKDITMQHFNERVVETENGYEVLFITYLDSETFMDDIACFVSNVLDFKDQYKNKNLDD